MEQEAIIENHVNGTGHRRNEEAESSVRHNQRAYTVLNAILEEKHEINFTLRTGKFTTCVNPASDIPLEGNSIRKL